MWGTVGVPILAGGVYLIVRLLVAPYYLWKEERLERNNLIAKIETFVENPISVTFETPELANSGWPIKVTNHGEVSQPIESVYLHLLRSDDRVEVFFTN